MRSPVLVGCLCFQRGGRCSQSQGGRPQREQTHKDAGWPSSKGPGRPGGCKRQTDRTFSLVGGCRPTQYCNNVKVATHATARALPWTVRMTFLLDPGRSVALGLRPRRYLGAHGPCHTTRPPILGRLHFYRAGQPQHCYLLSVVCPPAHVTLFVACAV